MATDSLRSVAFLRILDLIAEGEIVGLVDGAKSIYLNGTPLQSADGSFNFQNVEWEERKGAPNQEYLPGASTVEREVSVAAQFRYGEPSSGPQPSNIAQSGTAIVRTIVDPDVDSVRVRVSVPQLFLTNSSTGEQGGTQVTWSVWVRANGESDFTQVLSDTISGKTSSKYERTRIFDLPGSAPWTIRIQRDTPDSSSPYLLNTTVFESYTEIKNTKLTYPRSALISLKVDATQFSSVPTRMYEVDLLKIKIPSNYNDVTRTYTGIWNGEFVTSTGACSNPAWVFYDILTSPRYGLGKFIPEEHINKWALYEIARYCDELVDDGFGGQEPRFTCNLLIAGKTEAYTLLQSLASVFRGMIFWAGGTITPVQDSPKSLSYLYTQANVVDGIFSYSGSSAKTRYSVARVAWNDPERLYESTIEYIEDQDSIRDIGIVETDVVAFGCTSRSQARRLGKWIIYTGKYETETVTFRTGLEGLGCAPGDIIGISDPSRAGVVLGGRIHFAPSLFRVTLDREIPPGTTGSLLAMLENGALEERNIVGISGRTVEVGTGFSSSPIQQGAWIIRTPSVEPQLFRVTGVSEDSQEGTYTVTALKHYQEKFDLVEQGISFDPPEISTLEGNPPAPTGLLVEERLYSSLTDLKILAEFSWSSVPTASEYRVTYSFNGGPETQLPLTRNSFVELRDVQPGEYEFSVVAISPLGRESLRSSITKNIRGKAARPSDVMNFSAIPSNGNVILSWDRASDLDVLIGGFIKVRWSPKLEGAIWPNAIDILPALTGNSTQAVAPLLAGTYLAKFIDSSGNYSENAASIVTVIPDSYLLNPVVTLTEHPLFEGDKNRMEYVESEQALRLISELSMDDVQSIDDLGSFDFFGPLVGEAEYIFKNSVDLGGVWPFRVKIHVDVEAFNTGAFIDERISEIDTWASFDSSEINDTDAQVYMRTTEDDPSDPEAVWTEWKKITNAGYVARGAQFKLACYTEEADHNFWVRELSVSLEMDDRTYGSGKLTSSDMGDISVTFDSPFYAVPSLAVTAENMESGDYYTISSLTESGFDIGFFNSSNDRVIRDFYVSAKSYGRRID